MVLSAQSVGDKALKPIAAYYRFSKKDKNRNPDSHRSHIFRLKKAIADLGGDPEDAWLFLDEMSGRRNDRPNFQKLIQMIDKREIEIVVVRLDRLSRDSDMFQTLAKLFERTGVKLYETIRGRFIDFDNPDEWAEFQRSGINAEHEARVVSRRAKERKEFMRFEGKVQGGRMPYGYRRSPDGFYEPVPEQWTIAQEMIQIFLNCKSTMVSVREIQARFGLQYAYNGFHKWLQNPVLRGHTAYYDKQRDTAKGKRIPCEIRWNTHAALVNAETATEIDRILANNQRFRGRTKQYEPRPLSGLLWCDRCGSVAHICGSVARRQYTMIYCNAYKKGYGCVWTEPTRNGRNPSVGTRYSDVDAAVIEALMNKSQEVAIAGTTIRDADPIESAEILTLRQQIQKYEAMEDPDLQPVLDKKKAQLQQLLTSNTTNSNTLRHSREKLARYAQIPDFWAMLIDVERSLVYREFVDKVFCSGSSIRVLLKI